VNEIPGDKKNKPQKSIFRASFTWLALSLLIADLALVLFLISGIVFPAKKVSAAAQQTIASQAERYADSAKVSPIVAQPRIHPVKRPQRVAVTHVVEHIVTAQAHEPIVTAQAVEPQREP
jgi:hypothetical protein